MKKQMRAVLFLAVLLLCQRSLVAQDWEFPIDFRNQRMSVTGGRVLSATADALVLEFEPLSKDIRVDLPLDGFDATCCDRLQMAVDASKTFSKFQLSCLGVENNMPFLSRHSWPEKGRSVIGGFFPDVGTEKKLAVLKIRIQDFSEIPGKLSKPVLNRTVRLSRAAFIADDSLLPEQLTPYVYRGSAPLDAKQQEAVATLSKKYSETRAALRKAEAPGTVQALLSELHRMRLQDAYSCEKQLLAMLTANGRTVCASGNGVDKIFRERAFPGTIGGKAVIKLALNESEAAQVAIYAARPLKNVTIECAAPVMGSETLSVSAAPVGYVKRPVAPNYYRTADSYWPDPVLEDLASFEVEKERWQPVWVEVRSRKDQKPGTYTGAVTFRENGKVVASVPLEVTVWDFRLPDSNTFPIAISGGFSLGPDTAVSKFYCSDPKIRREAAAFLMYGAPEDRAKLSPEAARLADIVQKCVDAFSLHRVPDNSLYHDLWAETPPKYRKKHLAEKSLFNLGNPYGGKNDLESLRKQVTAARADGTLPYACVYGFDEVKTLNDFQDLSRTFARFKKEFPDLRTMTTAWDYTLGDHFDAWKYTDVWILPTQVFLSRLAVVEKARKRGQHVWWYTCDYPSPPSANMMLENSGVSTRALSGFMPWKFGAEGFLFYASASWSDRAPTPCLLFGWKGVPRKQVVMVGPELDGEPWFQEYELTATEASPKVSLSSKWRRLSQKETSPSITFRADVKVVDFTPSDASKFTLTATIKYASGKKDILRLPFDAGKSGWVHLEKTVKPPAPIEASIAELRLAGAGNRVRVKNVCLSAEGVTALKLIHLTKPYADRVLTDIPYPGYSASGCGSWILPGKNGPVPTIRLKNFRDGLDDYEYLALLKKTLEQVEKQPSANFATKAWIRDAQKVLRVNGEVCRDIDRYAEKGCVLLREREKVAALLEHAPVKIK